MHWDDTASCRNCNVRVQAGRCAYAVLLMATLWTTEAIPMAVTAVLPVVLFPWLGVMSTDDVCRNYLRVCGNFTDT